jgi:hypothetical protein
MHLKNLYIFCFAAFLFSSCATNNYVLNSINNPFVDSSSVGNTKVITSLDAVQFQATSRIYKNFVFMCDYFTDNGLSYNDRRSLSGGIGYNFILFQKYPKVKMNISAGANSGNTKTGSDTRIESYSSHGNSTYNSYFLQTGIQLPIKKRLEIIMSYKLNLVKYSNYYFYINLDKHQTDRDYDTFDQTRNHVSETVVFSNKIALAHLFSLNVKWNINRTVNVIHELGVSVSQPLFNVNDYTIRNSTFDGKVEISSPKNIHPYYSPFYIRVGLQFNLPNNLFAKQK